MKNADAVSALAALAQEHRLAVYRLLVKSGPDGSAAGEIADSLKLPASSLSFHLSHLNRAGLITQQREGRSLIYAADFDRMNDLLAYLIEDCCQGRPEICTPMAQTVSRAACCPPTSKKKVRA